MPPPPADDMPPPPADDMPPPPRPDDMPPPTDEANRRLDPLANAPPPPPMPQEPTPPPHPDQPPLPPVASAAAASPPALGEVDGERGVDCQAVEDYAQKNAYDLSGYPKGGLKGKDLRGLQLQWGGGAVFPSNADLRGSDLRGANLSGCELPNAKLCRAKLQHAVIRDANLEMADLEKAVLRGADLSGANLRKATFDRADLSGSYYYVGGEWRGVDGPVLQSAKLAGATFSRADLSGADFYGADFGKGTMLSSEAAPVTMRGTNLKKAKLAGAEVMARAPPGPTPHCRGCAPEAMPHVRVAVRPHPAMLLAMVLHSSPTRK
jgi:uncharacterized protein YjbI with pentapeptide repeats